MSYAALEDVYRVEVIGAFAAAKSVLPGMIKRQRILFKRDGCFSRLKHPSALCHREVWAAGAVTELVQGLRQERRPYRTFQTGLRPRCPDHARPLWPQLRSRKTGAYGSLGLF